MNTDHSYISTFDKQTKFASRGHICVRKEIAEHLNNPDCDEVILGQEIETIGEHHRVLVLIIYKKVDDSYIYRQLMNDEFYEINVDNTCIVCYNYNIRGKIYAVMQHHVQIWSFEQLDVLFPLLELMHQNNWTHPQINDWLQNPCFK